jgi:hypothetical protein
MSAQSIEQPYPIFTDADGDPLENGYIWIGVKNLYPITNPVAVYWDAALTQPAVQPIRTSGGYPVNAGTPARLYTASSYSILAQDRNGIAVYSAQSDTALISSDAITFLPAGVSVASRTAQEKLRERLSFEDLGAIGDGVSDDGAIINAAIYARYNGLAISQSQVFVELHGTAGKTYLFATPVTVRQQRIRFIGNGATITCTGAYAFDITQDGSANGNEEGSIVGWKITGATTAAIRGRACNFWHLTDNWITGNAIGIDVCGVQTEIANNYVRENSSFGVLVQSAIAVGGGVIESQRCVISKNRIWLNGSYGLYLIDGGGHYVDGNDLEVNGVVQLYIRCSFGNFISGLYAEVDSGSIIQIDNVAALAVSRFADSNQIIGGTFGGGASNDIQIIGGNGTVIAGVRFGTGNVVIGASVSNTLLLQQATVPIVYNNGLATTDFSQNGVAKWYVSTALRFSIDTTLAGGAAVGGGDSACRLYGISGLSTNQNLPRNFVGFADISGAATTSVVTFGSAEPTAAYSIHLTVMDLSGAPAANSRIAYADATSRSTAGFTINLVAAPGVGTSVRVHWMIIQQ